MSHSIIPAVVLVLLCSLIGGGANAQRMSETAELPPYFFRQDWCPTQADIEALEPHFALSFNDCCIAEARRKNSDAAAAQAALRPLERFRTLAEPAGECRGGSETDQQRREAARAAAITALNVKRRQEQSHLPTALRAMELGSLCNAFGKLVRKQEPLSSAPTLRFDAAALVRTELARRGSPLNEARITSPRIALGDSQCQVIAALGLPDDINRTITNAGTKLQYVYGIKRYVYFNNGSVTAMQD